MFREMYDSWRDRMRLRHLGMGVMLEDCSIGDAVEIVIDGQGRTYVRKALSAPSRAIAGKEEE